MVVIQTRDPVPGGGSDGSTLPPPRAHAQGQSLCQEAAAFSRASGGPGLLTKLCGQHCEVVPDSSLAVQGHGCADGAVLRLNGEAALHIRVGEDGVSGEDRVELGLIWGQGHSLLLSAPRPPFLLFPLLGLLPMHSQP